MKNKIDTIFDTDFYNGLNNHKKLFQILIFFIIYIWLIYYIYSLFSFYQYFTSYSQYTGYIKSCDKNEIEEINNLKPILLKHNTTEKYTYIITIIIFVILVLIYSYILFDKKDDLNIHDNINKFVENIDVNNFIIYTIFYIFFALKISYVDDNILNQNHDMGFNIVINLLIACLLLSLKFKKDYSYYIFILIIFSIIINFIYNYISYNEDPDTKNFTNKKKINLDIIMNLLLYFFGIIISIYLLLRNENRYHYSNLIKTFIHLFILIFIITFIFIIHYYSKFNNTLYNYDGFFGIKTHHKEDDINDRNFIDDFTTTFYVLFIVSTIIILLITKNHRNTNSEFDHIPNILTMFLIFTILLFITGGLYKGYKYHTDFTQDSYDYKTPLYDKNIELSKEKNIQNYLKWKLITDTDIDNLKEYTSNIVNDDDEKNSVALYNILIRKYLYQSQVEGKDSRIIELSQEEWNRLKITDFKQDNYVANTNNKMYFKLITIQDTKSIVFNKQKLIDNKFIDNKNSDFDNIIKNYKQINNDFEELNFIIIPLFNIVEGETTTYNNFILIDNNNTSHNKQFNSFYDEFKEKIKEEKQNIRNKYNNNVKNYIINNISTKYYPISYLKKDEDEDIKKYEEQIYNKITNLFTFIIITTLIISIIMYSYFKEYSYSYSYYYNINNLILILITISIIIIIITDIYLKNI